MSNIPQCPTSFSLSSRLGILTLPKLRYRRSCILEVASYQPRRQAEACRTFRRCLHRTRAAFRFLVQSPFLPLMIYACQSKLSGERWITKSEIQQIISHCFAMSSPVGRDCLRTVRGQTNSDARSDIQLERVSLRNFWTGALVG